MEKKIIGYFENRESAEEAVKKLKKQGISEEDVSLISRDDSGSGDDARNNANQTAYEGESTLRNGVEDGIYNIEGIGTLGAWGLVE